MPRTSKIYNARWARSATLAHPMRFITALFILLLLGAAHVRAQGTVTATWDPNPEANIGGYRLIIDSSITDVGNVTIFQTGIIPAGNHVAALLAYTTDQPPLVSPPSDPVHFTVAAVQDPCAPPLGAHAPAIFPTSPTITTGRPGSPSFMNYLLGGPDAVVEIAVQVDNADVVVAPGPGEPRGANLKAFSGMWFTTPPAGSHVVGIRVVTAFGCALTRTAAQPFVVKP